VSDLIGLLPAAGRGSRLGVIPCSKEIMPLGFQLQDGAAPGRWQPVTAIETHLQGLRLAGAERAVVIVSESKADIMRYIGDGQRYGLSIGYLYQQRLSGMPFALDLAAPWVGAATTVFAMPDTILTPSDTIARLVRQHRSQAADVTLGLFETSTPHKFGMVDLAEDGSIRRFVDKPAQTNLNMMWGLAVWSPAFTQYMRAYLGSVARVDSEIVLSDVFQAALDDGLTFQGMCIAGARYQDIGTPEDFQTVVYELAGRQASYFGRKSAPDQAKSDGLPESSSR
jgi:glucose-1-phosphate thymidylyltransferase